MSNTSDSAKTPEPYSLEDVMQAVCAALLFAEDIGIEALTTMQGHLRSHEKLESPVTLYPGAGNEVTLTSLAVHLVGTAYHELPTRCIAISHSGGRTVYDLTRGES